MKRDTLRKVVAANFALLALILFVVVATLVLILMGIGR